MTSTDQLVLTEAAAHKVKILIEEEGNPELKLRVAICASEGSGFQYSFTFDELIQDGDTEIVKEGVKLLIDSMSYPYLVSAEIDYTEGLKGSQFVIRNQDDEPPPALSNAMRPG